MPGESFLFQSLKMSSIAGLEEEAFLLMEDFFLMRAFSFVFLAVLGGFFFGVFFGAFFEVLFGDFMGPTPCDEGVAPRRSQELPQYDSGDARAPAENLDGFVLACQRATRGILQRPPRGRL